MEDKRRFSRVSFQVKAKIAWRGKSVSGDVSNLSLRGMFLQTGEAFNPGESVAISMQLIGETSDLKVSMNGIVVRAVPEGIGIEFDQLDLDSFIHLRNIVSYNSGNADQIDSEFMSFVQQRGTTAI